MAKNLHHQPRDLSDYERATFRRIAQDSHQAKQRAMRGEGPEPLHDINVPVLDPLELMPAMQPNGLRALSLFSGGGGLDLGFEQAGFTHIASHDILSEAAATLHRLRPAWKVFGGEEGDVTRIEWEHWGGQIDVLHGGPPCQPFSMAGRQNGANDSRDMFPTFVRAVLAVVPRAFIAENVPALGGAKFRTYVDQTIIRPLLSKYEIFNFELSAGVFGVPQVRRRIFFVGFRRPFDTRGYRLPAPSFGLGQRRSDPQLTLFRTQEGGLPSCMGTREALGLPDIGYDALAPTIRSSLTGPRHTTSILSSVSAMRVWERLQIWPNGVAPDREKARLFVPKNGHFRLSVADCALLQGFPDSWSFKGATYMSLGQIGNAVPPPLAYAVASSVAEALC